MRASTAVATRAACVFVCVLILCLEATAASTPAVTRLRQDPADTPPSTAVDVVVLDREGRFVEGLEAADFTVTVDGRSRRVLGVRRVSRGPGAVSDATLRVADSTTTVFAAEPIRRIVVLVDQSTLVRGEERTVVRAVGALLDRLGLDDQVAVVGLPLTSTMALEMTSDRPTAREALGGLAGRATHRGALAADAAAAALPRDISVDPERERAVVSELAEPPLTARAEAPEMSEDAEMGLLGDALGDVHGVLKALQSIPGRKVVALFSEGLRAAPLQVTAVAAAASAGHTVIHTFGLPASSRDAATPFDPAALGALARGTGGMNVPLGRNPQRDVERVVQHLSACYVLAVESQESDFSSRAPSIRVEVARRGLTLYTAAWLASRPDAPDVAAVPEVASVAAPPPAPAAPGRGRPEPRSETRSSRDADLPLAMARLTEYVAGYERQYSALVAEEDYRQTARSERVHLRSDFLLVKAQDTDEWVSFRDVFRVNGEPVRDREDRLKKLFLDASPDAYQRLITIRDESARYNIGSVLRTINVPLFPLRFLTPENRQRCDFRLAAARDSHGTQVWRIEFAEREGPTLVDDGSGRMNFPATGWFLVERATGAIVETGIEFKRESFGVEIVVSYRRDPVLGLWVPERMNETYRERMEGFGGALQFTTTLRGEAFYSNFRRFQVRTEEKITIQKSPDDPELWD
jgi:VWFA-related protein